MPLSGSEENRIFDGDRLVRTCKLAVSNLEKWPIETEELGEVVRRTLRYQLGCDQMVLWQEIGESVR
jgi:hypothetical protein